MNSFIHRQIRRACCLTALFVFAVAAATADAEVINGVFAELDVMAPSGQDPYTGWTTDGAIGNAPFDRNEMAVFEVGDSTDAVHLQQEVQLDPNATVLSFEYRLSTIGIRDAAGTRDSFQAAIYEPVTFASLLGRDATFFPAFFSLDNDGSKFSSAFADNAVTGDVITVQLDVRSIAGQNVLLDFLLAEDPFSSDNLVTTVEVDNVIVASAVPEPSVWGGVLIGACIALRRKRRKAGQTKTA